MNRRDDIADGFTNGIKNREVDRQDRFRSVFVIFFMCFLLYSAFRWKRVNQRACLLVCRECSKVGCGGMARAVAVRRRASCLKQ